jgi:hypothetical protein
MKPHRRIVAIAAFLLTLGRAAPDPPTGWAGIGYCGPLKDVAAAKAAGFDYMEMRTSEVAALSDAGYQRLAAQLKQLAFPVPAPIGSFPPRLK